MRRLALVALLMLACGTAPAHAQTLSLAFAKGDVYRYTLHVTSKETIGFATMSMPFQMDLTADEAWTVKSIDASGVADVTLTLSNVNMKMSSTMGGSSTTTTTTKFPLPDQEFKIGPDGRMLSANGISVAGMTQYGLVGGGYLASAVLPDSAVQPGATWSKSFDQANPSGTGAVHVTTKSKYLRDETLKKVKAAVVETTSTETIDLTMDLAGMIPSLPTTGQSPSSPGPGPSLNGIGPITIKGTVTSDVTSWIDPGSHRILRSRMSSSNNMNMSIAMPLGPTSSTTNPPTQFPVSGDLAMKGSQTVDQQPA